jgi:hypothetical protein
MGGYNKACSYLAFLAHISSFHAELPCGDIEGMKRRRRCFS